MNRDAAKIDLGGARHIARGGGPAPVGALLGLLLLSSCAQFPHFVDPWAVDGRDGGGPVVTYPALMRIGAAAQAGGDPSAAVGIFRRAAQMNSEVAAPLVGAGNALLEMGDPNEAIVAYHGALERQPHDPEALRSLAKAYLKTARPA